MGPKSATSGETKTKKKTPIEARLAKSILKLRSSQMRAVAAAVAATDHEHAADFAAKIREEAESAAKA